MRNLEYKARVDDLDAYRAKAVQLGAVCRDEFDQTDTYVLVPGGRLKLREIAGREAELIHYKRDELGADRASDYDVINTSEPGPLRDMLEAALGLRAVVRKHRTLFVLDGARIHLDNVESLGSFLELEVPVDGGNDTTASETLNGLLVALGLTWNQGIRASYVDLATETKS